MNVFWIAALQNNSSFKNCVCSCESYVSCVLIMNYFRSWLFMVLRTSVEVDHVALKRIVRSMLNAFKVTISLLPRFCNTFSRSKIDVRPLCKRASCKLRLKGKRRIGSRNIFTDNNCNQFNTVIFSFSSNKE